MNILQALSIFSAVSFFVYGVAYFTSQHMKDEFKRFGLEKLGFLVIALEFAGALGLLVGLKVNPILLLSSGGLALLMFFGVLVRIKIKDGFWVSTPALFYMLLNAYIFYKSTGG